MRSDRLTHSRRNGLPPHRSSHHPTSHSDDILLDKIQDQQIYLCITNTLLTLAQQAGAPEDSILAVSNALLKARGLNSPHMLPPISLPANSSANSLQSYGWLEKGVSLKEQSALLQKIEKELLQSR
jgi:hypothetical protein